MLFKIMCNPMHPLNGALPGPSVYLCAAWLQNLAVPHVFYSPLSVPLERSCLLSVRWCESGGFQEQGQCFFIGLSCSIHTLVFYYVFISLLSVGWYCGAGVFGLIGYNISFSLSLALLTSFNNDNNNNNNNNNNNTSSLQVIWHYARELKILLRQLLELWLPWSKRCREVNMAPQVVVFEQPQYSVGWHGGNREVQAEATLWTDRWRK